MKYLYRDKIYDNLHSVVEEVCKDDEVLFQDALNISWQPSDIYYHFTDGGTSKQIFDEVVNSIVYGIEHLGYSVADINVEVMED